MPTQPLPQPPRKSESRFDEWLVLLWRRVSARRLEHTALPRHGFRFRRNPRRD